MAENPIHDITLTTPAYGGESLGQLPDGRAVFVPYTIPGETVRVRLVQEKRNYARAELLEVLTPSPDRITPRCIHFGMCGGCHYQYMPYKSQLTLKAEILRDQLTRIGRIDDPPVQLTVKSPKPIHYRNHVQFQLTKDGKLGYHKLRSKEVFAIQECHLPEEPLDAIWPQMDFESIPELERITLRLGADGEVQLVLESGDLRAPELLVEGLDISVVHLSPAGPLVLAGGDTVFIQVLDIPFRVSAGSFFQVNTLAAEAMVGYLLETLPIYLELTNETVLIDAYCGVGLFSAFLAPTVGRLIGIESNSSAVEDFIFNLDAFENVALYEDYAERVLPNLDVKPDIVLVDPPRGGVERRALDGLLHLGAPLVVYISCDPATLARDARRLSAGGYRLEKVTPFDLFPQTYHIESISIWLND